MDITSADTEVLLCGHGQHCSQQHRGTELKSVVPRGLEQSLCPHSICPWCGKCWALSEEQRPRALWGVEVQESVTQSQKGCKDGESGLQGAGPRAITRSTEAMASEQCLICGIDWKGSKRQVNNWRTSGHGRLSQVGQIRRSRLASLGTDHSPGVSGNEISPGPCRF